MPKANGVILYEGPSMLDGVTPIVAIATLSVSANAKTGDMIQTWIMRQDQTPYAAAYGATDGAICGDGENRCPFAINSDGVRQCYVNVLYAPRSVWNAYVAGKYRSYNGEPIARRRMVRIGSYGDPAAVPVSVWDSLIVGAKGHTGYTHQWRNSGDYRHLLMASVENVEDAIAAESMGWRAFAVLTSAPNKSMIHCPASKERGAILQCGDCMACSGANPNKRSVWILQHGTVKPQTK